MTSDHKKLLLIGCGKLGTVLLDSWLHNKTFHEIVVVQPSLSAQKFFENFTQLTFVKSHKDIPLSFQPDIIAIAVKPKQVLDTLKNYTIYQDISLFVSLATGISINRMHPVLGPKANIVRLMPNVAVQIGQSLNLAYALPSLNPAYKNLTQKIFDCTGKLIWIDSEELIDTLTPISGSGPAYFFLLTEILADKISEQGISKETALTIANQIFLGSALLIEKNPNLQELRSSVTSKGGVTEAAIEVLEPRLPSLVKEALGAAMQRLKQLL